MRALMLLAALAAAAPPVALAARATAGGGVRVEAAGFALQLEPLAGWQPLAHGDASEGLAVARLEASGRFSDYRGQALPPGVYVLVYARQPPLKAHFGTAPGPDFALAVPAAVAAEVRGVGDAIRRSRAASGSGHALVLRLVRGAASSALVTGPDARGEQVVWLRGAGPEAAGIVVVGRAAEPEV